ncbi:hypothetical protein NF27_FX00340 [Candidatus Jidaibacter acanthamoeba]|uniref:Cell division coordinator CpoB n=2 Tax=Candidatus Jidaibacter acanthamoebae TaxID=86105 RepID=A0A0C1QKW9_9RICK|nr:hypothetical protein NF27_FX00340 [Candidatus Jidaibacter acanthamoeba]
MYMKKILFLFACCLSLNANAVAQLSDESSLLRKPKLSETDLFARVEGIEQNMVALQKQIYSEPKTSGDSSNAAVSAQFDELYQLLKTIRGDIEQLQFEYSQLNDKFIKFSSDIEYRFNELNQRKDQTKINASEADKKLDSIDEQLTEQNVFKGSDQKALEKKAKQEQSLNKTKNSTKDDQGEILYKKAYAAIKEKDADKALKSFQEFIDNNSNHVRVSEAQFWIGEINFQAEKYNQAAIRYLKSYQQNSNGDKAPDSLVKLGESLGRLHKVKQACFTFAKFKKEFPNASTFLKKRANEQIESLGCK